MSFHNPHPPVLAEEAAQVRALLAIPGARRILADRVEFYINMLDVMSSDPDGDGDDPLLVAEDDELSIRELNTVDEEWPLGWSGVSQLRLSGYQEGDNTAPERAGVGFVRCALDDHEPSLGWTIDGQGRFQTTIASTTATRTRATPDPEPSTTSPRSAGRMEGRRSPFTVTLAASSNSTRPMPSHRSAR